MEVAHENLLENFEEFELDLEVEEILKKVKAEWVLDQGVTEFGEKLKEREQLKQAARSTWVSSKIWRGCVSSGHGGIGILDPGW